MKSIKKEITLIIVLSFLILLPPVLRFFFSEEKLSKRAEEKTNQTLICEGINADHYKITYKTEYQTGKVKKITISFEDQEENRNSTQTTATTKQMDYFASIPESTYEYLNSNLIVTLTQEVYQQRKKEEPIKDMYSSYNSLKEYYQKLGYTCKE